jgi:hypothetical protein
MKTSKLFFVLLVAIVLNSIHKTMQAQDKFTISAGFGVPEWLYVGAKIPVNQFQFEVTAGASPIEDDNLFSMAGNFQYHFAGTSKFSNLKPWYGKTGLVYMRQNLEYYLHEYLYWNIRAGRDFNITKQFGISVDVGLIIELHSWETIKKQEPSSDFDINLEYPVLPSLSGSLFYRF